MHQITHIATAAFAAIVLSSSAPAQTPSPWFRTYSGPAQGPDGAYHIVPGPLGEAYVSGFAAGGGNLDALILAFDADGQPLWERRIDTGGNEAALRVAFDDGLGALYALGNTSVAFGAAGKFLLWRLDPQTGNVVWAREYDGPALQGARGATLNVDAAGGILVGGALGASGSPTEALVVRYDANGTQSWTWTDPGRWSVTQLALAPNTDIGLQTTHAGALSPTKTLVRLTAAGVTIWSRDVGSTENGCFGPLFDSQSNVAYSINHANGNGPEIAKLDGAGNPLWSVSAQTHFGFNSSTYGLLVGSSDEVYAASSSAGVLRLDANGGLVWNESVPPTSWFDGGPWGGLTLAPNGDVVLRTRGQVQPGAERYDSVVAWNPNGQFLWSQAVRSLEQHDDLRTLGLAITPGGSVLVAGTTGPAGATDVVVAALREQSAAFCLGDGSAGPCPCGNLAAAPGGCRRGGSSIGARLDDQGVASLATDSLRFFGAQLPANATCFLIQAQPTAVGAVFQDGLLCLTGRVTRVYVGAASGQVADFPPSGSPSISARSALLGAPIAPGSTLGYQLYYRGGTGLCGAGAANLTNGIAVTWSL